MCVRVVPGAVSLMRTPAAAYSYAADRVIPVTAFLLAPYSGSPSTWTARIIDEVGPDIPVGAVGYGPESVNRLAALFR